MVEKVPSPKFISAYNSECKTLEIKILWMLLVKINITGFDGAFMAGILIRTKGVILGGTEYGL